MGKVPVKRKGITPKSWTEGTHRGVLHLGHRWYVISATLSAAGVPSGVRLDGPYATREEAEATMSGRR